MIEGPPGSEDLSGIPLSERTKMPEFGDGVSCAEGIRCELLTKLLIDRFDSISWHFLGT